MDWSASQHPGVAGSTEKLLPLVLVAGQQLPFGYHMEKRVTDRRKVTAELLD